MTTAAGQVGAPSVAEQQTALARALYAAGFRGNDLLHMMATALRESGGAAGATNNTAKPELPGYHAPGPGAQPEYSVGPLQIDLLQHTNITEAQARDPGSAAAYAYGLVYNPGSSGFGQWAAHARLTIEDFTQASRLLISSVPGNWTINNPVTPVRSSGAGPGASDPGALGGPQTGQEKGTPTPNPLDGLAAIGDALGKLTAPGLWPRLALTALAIGMIGAGIFLYAQQSATVRTAEKVAAA